MKTDKYLMAIDAGTGSVRAIIFDYYGHQISDAQQEWTHKADPCFPGSMDFDYSTNWEIIKNCIRDAIKESNINPSRICGIATSSMREGFVAYDKNGKELIAFSNVDTRSQAEAAELKRDLPTLEKDLYDKTGQTFALNAIPRLLWIKNHEPEVYDRIANINMLSDWISYKMSGRIIVEPSNGSTSGILSLKTRKWDTSIPEAANLKTDIFPPVVESGSIIGPVTASVCEETGLSASTLVVAGGGDSQLGCIGVGSIHDGQVALFGGSFWQYEYNTKNFIIDKDARLRMNCHAVPDLLQYEGIAWNCGLVMRWFRDAFCQEEQRFGKEHKLNFYDLMTPRATQIPAGSYGMITTFADVMNFIAMKHAAPTITNFQMDAERFNKFTLFHAIMENAALITMGHKKAIDNITGHETDEITFAGGSSNSPLWSQIVADTLGVRVKTPVVKEATALGAALLAGVGSGLYDNLEEAVETTVHIDRVYEPNMENHAVYERVFDKWQKVYQAQLRLADEKVTDYMWIAPGVK